MKVSRFLLIVSLAFLLLISPAFCQEKFDKDDFRKFVISEMQNFNVPGVAVLVIKDDKVIFCEGFGYRDVKKQLKVTPNTLFAIGSCTKAFTAFSIGLLVDEGKLDIDRPVRQYFPAFKMYDPYAAEHTTIRDLLCHRTGVPGYDFVWYHSGMTRDEVIDTVQYLMPSKPFRSAFQYNNIMYAVAGKVIEQVSGIKYEDFVKKRIFEPLGMKSSNLSVIDSQKSDDYALPYNFDTSKAKEIPDDFFKIPMKELEFYDINCVGPAGSINSNLVDMEKWLRLQLNKGKLGEKQFISMEYLKQMYSPQMPTEQLFGESPPELPLASYNLGWGTVIYRGHYMLSHAGAIDGFSASVTFMPLEKIGVVVLTNQHDNKMPSTIAFNVYDRLLGLDQIPWGKRSRDSINAQLKGMKAHIEAMEKNRKKNTSPSHPLKDYAGKYRHPAFGDVDVSFDGKQLKAKIKSKEYSLRHYHYDVFMPFEDDIFSPMNFLMIRFHMNQNGDIGTLSIPLQPGVDDIAFRRI